MRSKARNESRYKSQKAEHQVEGEKEFGKTVAGVTWKSEPEELNYGNWNARDRLREYFTHVCGASVIRVPGLIEAGAAAFSGDYLVDLDEALTNAAGRLVMMGNLNPVGTIATGTPEEVCNEACEDMG